MKNHYKFWIVLSFLVVFAAGIVSGVILDKYIMNAGSERRPREDRRDRVHFPTLNEMAEELELNDAQQEGIREVFKLNEDRIKLMREEWYEKFRQLRAQFLQEIKSVLDPEQIKKFDAMIEWYDQQRREELERRRQHAEDQKQDKGDSR